MPIKDIGPDWLLRAGVWFFGFISGSWAISFKVGQKFKEMNTDIETLKKAANVTCQDCAAHRDLIAQQQKSFTTSSIHDATDKMNREIAEIRTCMAGMASDIKHIAERM